MATELVRQDKPLITFADVKRYICPKASDAEIGLFLKICASHGLNPFAREIYLVKYDDAQPAAVVIAAEAYLKAAESSAQYDGHEAGVIIKDSSGKIEYREGSFILDEEQKYLAGGWARVYRKDRRYPVYVSVSLKECQKHTKTGKPIRFWDEMPATMVRKVALARALREAFPNCLGGTLSTAEFEEVPEDKLLALEDEQPVRAVDTGAEIDMDWLNEAKAKLRWTDETLLSFLSARYRVSGKTLTEALCRLTHEQAEDFTRQINTRLERG
ncbi:MAG: phage recombination protein Bet [Dehalococcoidales bacterium]|nr:phage recombination protein Bet [Dehalococcoidales bacterium]